MSNTHHTVRFEPPRDLLPRDVPQASGWLIRAGEFARDRRWDEALEALGEAVRLFPEDPHVYSMRANLYHIIGQAERAIDDATKVVALAPASRAGWMQRALGNARLAKHNEAIFDYTAAIRLGVSDALYCTMHLDHGATPFRQDAAAFTGRAECYAALKDYERALADFAKVIELEPLSSLGFERRAQLYRRMRAFQSAWSDCATALTLDPDSAHALAVRGTIHAHFHRDGMAIADFTRSLELRQNDSWTYGNRALAHFRVRQFDLAIADFTEALRLSPRWAAAFEGRARAYLGKREMSDAIADFTRALEIKPDMKRALELRGLAREAVGDYEGASADRLAADDLD